MSGLNRRDLLRGGLAAGATMLLGNGALASCAPNCTPKNLIIVWANGGWDPTFTFDLGEERTLEEVSIFFQPWDRGDELAEVKVDVSRDGVNFVDFNTYAGFASSRGKGAWAEMDLRAVKARFFRLAPKFQGWGHLWGEVEFWEIKR